MVLLIFADSIVEKNIENSAHWWDDVLDFGEKLPKREKERNGSISKKKMIA
jgi:hypothetical protein